MKYLNLHIAQAMTQSWGTGMPRESRTLIGRTWRKDSRPWNCTVTLRSPREERWNWWFQFLLCTRIPRLKQGKWCKADFASRSALSSLNPKRDGHRAMYKCVYLTELGIFDISGGAVLPSATDFYIIQHFQTRWALICQRWPHSSAGGGSCAVDVPADTAKLHFHLNHPHLRCFFSSTSLGCVSAQEHFQV